MEDLPINTGKSKESYRMLFQTIKKQNHIIIPLFEETTNVLNFLVNNEILIEDLKRELACVQESEARIRAERDNLKLRKENIFESRKNDSKSDILWKIDLNDKLDCALNESLNLRKRLQNEHEHHLKQINFLNQTTDSLKNQINKLKVIAEQNELLLNFVDELSISKFQESSIRESENTLKLMKYLRNEKNQSKFQLEILTYENKSLKSENELLKCQLEESQLRLKIGQNREDDWSIIANKRTEIFNRMKNVDLLLENNKNIINNIGALQFRFDEKENICEYADGVQGDNQLRKNITLFQANASSCVKCSVVDERNIPLLAELQKTSERLAKCITNEETSKSCISALKIEKKEIEDERNRLLYEMDSLKTPSAKQAEAVEEWNRLLQEITALQLSGSYEGLCEWNDFKGNNQTFGNFNEEFEIHEKQIPSDNVRLVEGNTIEPRLSMIESSSTFISDFLSANGGVEQSIEDYKFKLESDDDGETLFRAIRDFDMGDCILTEEPLIVGPIAEPRKPLCIGCGSVVSAEITCFVCGWPLCRKECKKLDLHKSFECEIFKRRPEMNFQKLTEATTGPFHQYNCILPLRVLLLSERKPLIGKRIRKMRSVNTECRSSAKCKQEKEYVINFIRRKCNLKKYSDELIHKICSILDLNCFILKSNFNIRCLYKTAHQIDHSCLPNTSWVISPKQDFKLIVTSAVKISGRSKLTLAKGRIDQPTLLRRQELLQSFGISCDCERCADPRELNSNFSSLRCMKCDLGLVTSKNPLDFGANWKCDNCSYEMKSSRLNKLFNTVGKELNEIEFTYNSNESAKKCEKLLEEYEHVFHFNHAFIVFLKFLSLSESQKCTAFSNELDSINRKIIRSYEILGVFDIITPGYSVPRASIFVGLCRMYMTKVQYYQTVEVNTEFSSRSMLKVQEILCMLEDFGGIVKLPKLSELNSKRTPVKKKKSSKRAREAEESTSLEFGNDRNKSKIKKPKYSEEGHKSSPSKNDSDETKEKLVALLKYRSDAKQYQIINSETQKVVSETHSFPEKIEPVYKVILETVDEQRDMEKGCDFDPSNMYENDEFDSADPLDP